MSVTLRQLGYFVAVAEHGTVTAAAAELYVSQSSISSAIGDLERALNVQLFVRHSRGLSLSGEGQALLPQARFLLRDMADFERSAAHLGDELTGSINIGCYSTIAPMLLPRAVATLAREYPALEVTFTEGSRTQLLDGLSLGRHDVLVLYDYRFKHDLPLVGQVERLGAFPPYALLPASHRLAEEKEVRLHELASDPFILFGLEPAEEYFLSMFNQVGVEPNVRYRTTNHEVLRGLVAQGVGYSLLTQRTRQTFSHEGIEYATAEISGPHDPLGVIAITPGRRGLLRKIDAFISIARSIVNDPLALNDR
ncbi:LysR substrate-binding domain-containing protein [Corynebacterium sp. YIM 101645]|uniref:LysR substrate-binding domain-containing protein n=1 Tax=Corynebacterium lemuris TaxID=1859292 RepID=A0ABT2G3U7_9CORY|nr:LysR substrate-binding domain-containing protein [Corynebacterium lemuris]MCS5480859.1 LysR substrate-binding domain-containing protein [Corynebacterium lemuris]